MTSIFPNSLNWWMRKRIQKRSHNPQGEEQAVVPIKMYPDKSSCWNPLISTFGNSCKVNYSSLRWKKANFWHLLWQWHALTFLELTSLKINDALKCGANILTGSYCGELMALAPLTANILHLLGLWSKFGGWEEGGKTFSAPGRVWVTGFGWEAITLHRQHNLFYLDNSSRECKPF